MKKLLPIIFLSIFVSACAGATTQSVLSYVGMAATVGDKAITVLKVASKIKKLPERVAYLGGKYCEFRVDYPDVVDEVRMELSQMLPIETVKAVKVFVDEKCPVKEIKNDVAP